MAAGDFDGDNGSVANDGTVTIRPGSAGVVWAVKEIGCSGAWELYSSNGTNVVKMDSWPSRKTITNRQLIATYTDYFYLKNVSGATATYHYKYGVLK